MPTQQGSPIHTITTLYTITSVIHLDIHSMPTQQGSPIHTTKTTLYTITSVIHLDIHSMPTQQGSPTHSYHVTMATAGVKSINYSSETLLLIKNLFAM